MADPKPYVMTVNKTLQFGIMIENAAKMTMTSQKDRLHAVADVLMSGDKSVVKKNHLVVTSRTMSKEHQFSFASLHHLPLPPDVEKAPMVVEVIFQENVADKLFVRIKNNLDHYDGVTATHTGFQVVEFMEHGVIDKVSPFPYTGTNGGPDSHNSLSRVLRFFSQLFRILTAVVLSLLSPSYWRGEWMPGPFQSSIEASRKGTRVCHRYNRIPESTPFSEIMAMTDAIKTLLGLPFYAITVNFSPTVALALVRTASELKTRDGRLASLTLPPAGTAPPPPMDAAQTASLFNCLFLNNYGKHSPNISGMVTDFLWDWTGMYETFLTFTHCIEVQGRKFVRWCAAAEEWKKLEAAGITEQLRRKLGEPEPFTIVPFYSKAK